MVARDGWGPDATPVLAVVYKVYRQWYSLKMRKWLQNVGMGVRELLNVPPPPAHYLERTKQTIILPWHVRVFGNSPWSGGIRKAVLAITLAGIAASVASVFYSRSVDTEERTFAAGISAIRSGDYKRAKTILEGTTRADPSNATAFYELGNAYWMLGDGTEAVEAWSGALRLDPSLEKAHIARGIQYFSSGNYEDSLKDFEQSVALRPSMESYLQQGMALQALGRHQEAMKSFDEAKKYATGDNDKEIAVASRASRQALKLKKIRVK
jgi:tetratricopeptide (TPR) repeat protein